MRHFRFNNFLSSDALNATCISTQCFLIFFVFSCLIFSIFEQHTFSFFLQLLVSSSLDSFLLVRFIYTCTALLWYLFFSQFHARGTPFAKKKKGGGGLLCKVSAAVQNYTIHALIIKYIDFASNIYTDYQIIKFLNPRLVFIRKNLLFATKFGNTCTVHKNSSVFYASAHMSKILSREVEFAVISNLHWNDTIQCNDSVSYKLHVLRYYVFWLNFNFLKFCPYPPPPPHHFSCHFRIIVPL